MSLLPLFRPSTPPSQRTCQPAPKDYESRRNTDLFRQIVGLRGRAFTALNSRQFVFPPVISSDSPTEYQMVLSTKYASLTANGSWLDNGWWREHLPDRLDYPAIKLYCRPDGGYHKSHD